MLEYWFPFAEIDYTRRLGTWCDGVPLLVVADINRTAFSVAGVGYFPYELSPFELDFYYEHRRDLHTTKIEFRFGILDARGGLRTFGTSKNPNTILSQRPREVREWAVAVELTALES